MLTSTPNRYRTSTSRPDTSFNQPSKSPGRYGNESERPLTPVEFGRRSRDTSADRSTGNYFFQPYNAPYVNGKRNSNFMHPSLTSNQVFYGGHDNGPKKDFPNDRSLTPKRDNTFRRDDVNDNVSYNVERGTKTPPPRARMDVGQDRKLNQTPKRVLFEDTSERRALNKSADILPQPRQSQINERSNNFYKNEEKSYNKSSEIIKAAGMPSGIKKVNDDIRDDVSEASTVMSTLSSTGYLCPKCLNKHMAGQKHAMCSVMREQEKEHVMKTHNSHMKLLEEEENRKKQERAKRLEDTKKLKEHLDREYEAKLERRRSPPKEQDLALKNIFDRQEELRQKQLILKQVFGTHLKEQIQTQRDRKEQEKLSNSQISGNSLQIGQGYRNKYVEHPTTVRLALQDQIQEKYVKQAREREMEKRAIQEKHEEDMRKHEETETQRQMKNWRQKNELRQAFEKSVEDKKAKQRDTMMNKSTERIMVDQGYQEHKRRQVEEEAKVKGRYFEFRQYLLSQQNKQSYREKYEERKQQKDATSFDPAKKLKKMYNCGECSDPYEKIHLTKLY